MQTSAAMETTAMDKPEPRAPIAAAAADFSALAQQRAFRLILDAFSYPGRIVGLDTPADHALPLVLATLADGAASLADPHGLVCAQDRRRFGVPDAAPSAAQFVVMPGDRLPDFEIALGTLESPEQGATVLLLADALGPHGDLQLSGPGIKGSTSLHVAGVDRRWWHMRALANSSFPLGLDLMLLCGRRLAALPRTVRVTIAGGR